MWQPEPGWQPLPGGLGPTTAGVWRAEVAGRLVVVKRLVPAPDLAHDEPGLADPRHFAYWRRAADVVTAATVVETPGLRSAGLGAVDEDEDGITITLEWVEDASNSGLFCAHAMGQFAGAHLAAAPWLGRNQLRDRLVRVERYGGWQTLARTTVADVADHLWSRRVELLAAVDALVQVPQHGDAVPANLLGRDGDDLVAIDWGTLGTGPVGGDLGYFALSAREELEPLIDAYLLGMPDGLATRDEVTLGARVTAVYTVLNRAEWALARAARGEGALAGKFRHPAVAPHLRALQRQFPHIEALVEG